MSFIKTNNSRIEINAIKPCPHFHSFIFFYLVLLPFSSSSFHIEVNIIKGLLQSCYLAILRLQDFINTEGLNQRSFFKKHPVLIFEVLKRGKKCYYLKQIVPVFVNFTKQKNNNCKSNFASYTSNTYLLDHCHSFVQWAEGPIINASCHY